MQDLKSVCLARLFTGAMTCGVSIINTGNLRIGSVELQGPQGNNCSREVVAPDETVHCFLWQDVTAEDFGQQQLLFQVTATGRPLGSTQVLQENLTVDIGLVRNTQLSVDLFVDNATITAEGRRCACMQKSLQSSLRQACIRQ